MGDPFAAFRDGYTPPETEKKPVEGDPGTWSHCGRREAHAPHLHTIVFNEGPYPDVQCNGTPGEAPSVVMEHREVKYHLVAPEDIPAFEAGGWRVRGQGPVAEERLVIKVRSGLSRGKYAAAAVHAALLHLGVHPGTPVIVLGANAGDIEGMATVVRDAGRTEVEPGTITAGTNGFETHG